MKVTLSDNSEVHVVIRYGEKEVEAFEKGSKITVKKRLITLSVKKPEGEVILEKTVSCSHKDHYNRRKGRQEALRALFHLDNQQPQRHFSRADRTKIAEAVSVS
jgi:hypothetical protein